MRIKRLKQSAGSVQNRSANNTGLQQQIFRVEKIAGESSGVDPPRCGSHRTAMPTEKRRGYGVSRRFSPSMKFGVAGAPVLNFGVKNRVTKMRKARNKGILDSKKRRYHLV